MAGAPLNPEPYTHPWGWTTSHILEHKLTCGWRSSFWDVAGALRGVAGGLRDMIRIGGVGVLLTTGRGYPQIV